VANVDVQKRIDRLPPGRKATPLSATPLWGCGRRPLAARSCVISDGRPRPLGLWEANNNAIPQRSRIVFPLSHTHHPGFSRIRPRPIRSPPSISPAAPTRSSNEPDPHRSVQPTLLICSFSDARAKCLNIAQSVCPPEPSILVVRIQAAYLSLRTLLPFYIIFGFGHEMTIIPAGKSRRGNR